MKRYLLITLLFILAIISFINSKQTSEYFYTQLLFVLKIIVPSLFPFMIFVNFLILSDSLFILKNLLRPFSKILNISEYGIICIISSLLGGYPYSAILVSSFIKKNMISKDEGNKIVHFCFFPSLSFLLSLINNNERIKYIVFIIFIVSFLPLVIIKKEKTNTTLPIKKEINKDLFFEVANDTFKSMFSISFAILFFSLISFYISILIKNEYLLSIISGMLEFSKTSIILSNSNNIYSLLILTFILSFGSFSIFFQMKYYLKDLKLSSLIITRLIIGIITTLICYFLLYNTYI